MTSRTQGTWTPQAGQKKKGNMDPEGRSVAEGDTKDKLSGVLGAVAWYVRVKNLLLYDLGGFSFQVK